MEELLKQIKQSVLLLKSILCHTTREHIINIGRAKIRLFR